MGKGEETIEELGDKSIVVHNTDTHSKIVFNSITKAHAGSYSVVVRNKSGEDSAKVSVKVLDRPAAPEGPMKVSAEDGAVTLFGIPSGLTYTFRVYAVNRIGVFGPLPR